MKTPADKDRLLNFDPGIAGFAESNAAAQSLVLSLYF